MDRDGSPQQKITADFFEAYVGGAFRDARERGTERAVIDFIEDLFHPKHWPELQKMAEDNIAAAFRGRNAPKVKRLDDASER